MPSPVARRARRDPALPLLTILLALALLAAGAVGLLSRPATTKQAEVAKRAPAVAATHGAGFTVRGQWIGTWRTPDGSGFCIEFDKAHPNSSGVKAVSKNVPGMSAAESAQVRYVTNKYGTTRSKVDGAAAAIYVWQVQNTDRFDDYYAKLVKARTVSGAVRQRLTEITAEAKNHGPYRLTMTMGAGYVGQSVKGRVTVRAANGKAIKGMRIALAPNGSGVVTKKDQASDAKGRVDFTARVVQAGAMQVNATLASPGPAVWITRPTAGRQRLVLAGRQTATAKATALSERRIGAPTVTSECGTDCNGVAPVVVRMSNPCGSMTLREFVYRRGSKAPVAVVDVPACRSARTSVMLPDNAVVTTAHCYLNAAKRCIAPAKANAGALRVECPPMVEYRFSGVCPCLKAKNVTYQVKAPAGSVRKYTVTMVSTGAGGTRTDRLVLENGVWSSLPAVSLRKGDTVRLSVTVLGKTRPLEAMSQDL